MQLLDRLERAKNGDKEAQYDLGVSYYRGICLPINYKHALYWLKLAANQNCQKSKNCLGEMYFTGMGVKKNYKKARLLFLAAAQALNEDACGNLSKLYAGGCGVTINIKDAYMWANIWSALRGRRLSRYSQPHPVSGKSHSKRDELCNKLTHEDVVESQKAASTWWNTYVLHQPDVTQTQLNTAAA